MTAKAPPPTEAQLRLLGEVLGREPVRIGRLEGGIGCTMDLLAVGDAKAILRRYGPWYEPADWPAEKESAVLERLLEAGLAVPEPLWRDVDDVFDEHALLISYLEGAPLFHADDPLDWADQLARHLVRVHEVDPTGLPEPMEAIDLEASMPGRFGEFTMGAELWEGLLGTRPDPGGTVFLHGDYWPGNTLWRDGRLVAIIDWEHPAIGDPMLDVAYSSMDLRYFFGDDRLAERFVDTYLETSGRSPETLRHWELQALARPVPDIAPWVRAWEGLGLSVPVAVARRRHLELVRRYVG